MWLETGSFIRVMQGSQKNLMNQIDYPHFAQSFQPLVPARTTKQNFSYGYFKNLPLTSTQSRIRFHFQMKFVTKALVHTWLRLTSSLYSPIYHWMRQLTFVCNCYFTKREKLKECLKNL